MGVPRESDGIGVLREDFCRGPIILSPGPRTIAGVAQVGMLDVEEGLFAFHLFAVLLEKLSQPWYVVCMPVGSDERVALHRLNPDGRVIFFETGLPHFGGTQSDALFLGCGSIRPVPTVAVHVVIAVDEKLFHVRSVWHLVVGKYLVPGICHHLQLGLQSPVGQVASHYQSVDLLVTEIFQGMNESLGRGGIADVYVAQYADDQVRFA